MKIDTREKDKNDHSLPFLAMLCRSKLAAVNVYCIESLKWCFLDFFIFVN